MLLNYEVLVLGFITMIGGMGYMVSSTYRRESQVARVHRGLRKYVRRADYATQEIS